MTDKKEPIVPVEMTGPAGRVCVMPDQVASYKGRGYTEAKPAPKRVRLADAVAAAAKKSKPAKEG